YVVKMGNYRRSSWYDETGLHWIGPSPNLRTLTSAMLYPGVGMIEASNVSVGRGTGFPFEVVGAPWIDGEQLAAYLNRRKINGASFIPINFRPSDDRYQARLCHGVRIVVQNRNDLDAPALGIELASAIYRLYRSEFQIDKILGMIGAPAVLKAIKDGQDPTSIERELIPSLDKFRELRAKYLLYPSTIGK
ncbi:MAG TPA: exo-beta-N-acetylmuramidase NamZ domain-containing protein, partial [Candidatus Binatia bacterium]